MILLVNPRATRPANRRFPLSVMAIGAALPATENWEIVDGNLPDTGVLSPEVLTRTVLDGGVGQGFFPGIEAGVIITNQSIYAEPFRIGATVVPGDLTALMALPWQADFLKCNGKWWPSQRPDDAPQEDDPVNHIEEWARSIDDHRALVNNFGRLGFIVSKEINGGDAFVEQDRDPNF